MDSYEKLLAEIENHSIVDENSNLPDDVLGYYIETKVDNLILINKNIECKKSKICTLAEEIGHYHTTYGDISDQSKIENRKQERIARAWGYERLVSLLNLINAKKEGIRNRYELAEYLGVTEEFLIATLKYYKEKYGKMCFIGDYIIEFEPLEVYKRVEFEPGSKKY